MVIERNSNGNEKKSFLHLSNTSNIRLLVLH